MLIYIQIDNPSYIEGFLYFKENLNPELFSRHPNRMTVSRNVKLLGKVTSLDSWVLHFMGDNLIFTFFSYNLIST